jgi:hypothetical protein
LDELIEILSEVISEFAGPLALALIGIILISLFVVFA